MVNYIIGAMLILIGIAISRFPNLLIVYSQMGEQEREKLEKEGFLKLCKKAFIRVGIITIVVQAIFNQSHWTILVPLVGVLRIVFLLYMKKRELVGTKKWENAILGIVIVISVLLVPALIYNEAKEQEVIVDEMTLKNSGNYSFSVPLKEIKQVKILDRAPEFDKKVNGFAFFGVGKGKFRTKDKKEYQVSIYSDKTPCVEVQYGQKTLIFNTKDAQKTIEKAKEIEQAIEKIK